MSEVVIKIEDLHENIDLELYVGDFDRWYTKLEGKGKGEKKILILR